MAQNDKQPNHKAKLRERIKQKRENHLAHREERETKERERFTAAPTGRQARHQARAYANQEYGPTIRGIRQEEASLGKQAQQADQWYNQLAGEQTQAAQAQESGAQQFGASLTQQLASANAQNASYLASQQAAQQQQAALTGQPLLASSGEAAAAGATMGALQGIALNAPVQEQAHSQAALTRRLGIASREQGHATKEGILGERKKVRQDRLDGQKQKGQAYVGRLVEIRNSAIKQENDKKAFELEGQQTALQAQQEAAKLKQDEEQSKRQAETTRRGQNTTAASSAASTAASVEGNQISRENAETAQQKAHREQREYNEERRFKKSHHGMTPAEVRAVKKERQPSTSEKSDKRENIQNGYAAAQQAIKALGKSPATYSPAEWLALEQYLTAPKTGLEPGSGIDPAVARKVVAAIKRRVQEKAEPKTPGEAAANAVRAINP